MPLNALETSFAGDRTARRTGIIPFIVGGSPSIQSMQESLLALAKLGCTAIEVGLPFSDPIADGPVIAQAMHEVLAGSVTVGRVLAGIREVAPSCAAPLVAMSSQSLVERCGMASFASQLAQAGFSGLITPDGDLDGSESLRVACRGAGLATPWLVAPRTDATRARRLVRASSGFVYVLSRAGLTGAGGGMDRLESRVRDLRSLTDLPLAVGFGIGTAAQVREATKSADAAIIGSALVRAMTAAGPSGAAKAAAGLLAELKTGLSARSVSTAAERR